MTPHLMRPEWKMIVESIDYVLDNRLYIPEYEQFLLESIIQKIEHCLNLEEREQLKIVSFVSQRKGDKLDG